MLLLSLPFQPSAPKAQHNAAAQTPCVQVWYQIVHFAIAIASKYTYGVEKEAMR